MGKRRALTSAGSGIGVAVGVGVARLASAIHDGVGAGQAAAHAAPVAAIAFLMGSGAAFLAARLRETR